MPQAGAFQGRVKRAGVFAASLLMTRKRSATPIGLDGRVSWPQAVHLSAVCEEKL
jgi:hypothetical protein